MTEPLNRQQLKRLTEHKYSCGSASVLDPYMQVFWKWLVEQVPLWWAPNAITLVGLALNILSTLLIVYYSPDGKSDVPAYACCLAAMGLFGYQALDAIDGKQARRTKSNTPLGELFDHGCDSLSTVFVALGTCVAMNMGHQPGWFFFNAFCSMFLFYAAHWQSYVSGTLNFGKFDVTEAQFAVISVYLITAVTGTGFWDSALPVIGVTVKMIPICFAIITSLMSLQMNFSKIFMVGGSGKNGATIADTSVLSPVLPFAIVILLAVMIWKKSTSLLFETNPVLYVLAFGMVSTKITNKLVIAHMTKHEMEVLDSCLIGPGMLFLNQYFNFIIDEYYVLWMCLIFGSVDMLRFSAAVCTQICNHLGIYCFKISLPEDVGPQDNGVRTEPKQTEELNKPTLRSSTRAASVN